MKERLVVFRAERERPARRMPCPFGVFSWDCWRSSGEIPLKMLWRSPFPGCPTKSRWQPDIGIWRGYSFLYELFYSSGLYYISTLIKLFDDAGDINAGKFCECRLCIYVWSMPLQLHLNHHFTNDRNSPPANKRKDRMFFRTPRRYPQNLFCLKSPFKNGPCYISVHEIHDHFAVVIHGRNKIWSSWIPFALQKLGAWIFWGLGISWKAKPSTGG